MSRFLRNAAFAVVAIQLIQLLHIRNAVNANGGLCKRYGPSPQPVCGSAKREVRLDQKAAFEVRQRRQPLRTILELDSGMAKQIEKDLRLIPELANSIITAAEMEHLRYRTHRWHKTLHCAIDKLFDLTAIARDCAETIAEANRRLQNKENLPEEKLRRYTIALRLNQQKLTAKIPQICTAVANVRRIMDS